MKKQLREEWCNIKNEKYGVEIEAITSPFEKKIKQLENDTKKFGETAKKNLGFEADVDTKKVEAKIAQNKIKQSIEEQIFLNIFLSPKKNISQI